MRQFTTVELFVVRATALAAGHASWGWLPVDIDLAKLTPQQRAALEDALDWKRSTPRFAWTCEEGSPDLATADHESFVATLDAWIARQAEEAAAQEAARVEQAAKAAQDAALVDEMVAKIEALGAEGLASINDNLRGILQKFGVADYTVRSRIADRLESLTTAAAAIRQAREQAERVAQEAMIGAKLRAGQVVITENRVIWPATPRWPGPHYHIYEETYDGVAALHADRDKAPKYLDVLPAAWSWVERCAQHLTPALDAGYRCSDAARDVMYRYVDDMLGCSSAGPSLNAATAPSPEALEWHESVTAQAADIMSRVPGLTLKVSKLREDGSIAVVIDTPWGNTTHAIPAPAATRR